MLEKWVGEINDPEKTFKKIDKNGGGMILFDEFCDYAWERNLDLDDDDDWVIIMIKINSLLNKNFM